MLGRPDLRYRRVHIVGTKGKGSTTVMLSGILEQLGLRVGMYTSPHLIDINERIQVNCRPVAQAVLVKIYESRVKPAIDCLPPELGGPTYFEVLTVLALEAFSEAGVQVSVIEAGLGGKLDSTNAIAPPDVIVVVPISLDHTQILGSTTAQIAWDKTAVFKTGSRIVAARQLDEVTNIVAVEAERKGCSISWVDSEIHVDRRPDVGSQQLRLRVGNQVIDVKLPLAGLHQAKNAATAVLAAKTLLDADQDQSLAQGLYSAFPRRMSPSARQLRYRPDAIRSGLESVRLRGRFESVSSRPPVIVDVAHNEASAQSLAATVSEMQAGSVVYVIGLSSDKDVAAFVKALAPTAKAFVFVQADHPRARDAEELAKAATATLNGVDVGAEPVLRVGTAPSVIAGLHAARAVAGSDPIVVTGSFYVVSETINSLQSTLGSHQMPLM
jgi:dihydrofolate synthase/folylpolyglutamate synthase